MILTTPAQSNPFPFAHPTLAFSFADVPGQIKIGTVPAGVMVSKVALEITVPFDHPPLLEVGRLLAPAELMVGTDNNPAVDDVYHVTPDKLYTGATDVYLTLITVGIAPTAGVGRVVVYLN